MITILCSGSRGDFQPYIALAQELKARGHTVRITGSSEFKDFIESYGIECFPLKFGLSNVEVDPKLLEAAGSSDNPLKMLLTFNKMKDYGVHMVGDMYAACAGSDLIVYHLRQERKRHATVHQCGFLDSAYRSAVARPTAGLWQLEHSSTQILPLA